MPSDPAPLALQLMEIDSTTGREGDVVALAERLLVQRGWNVKRIAASEGRDNLLATTAAAPAVTLSTHLDTVPPYIAPRMDGDRLYGRGACDAKGIAAAMWCAAERLRERDFPVALLFVVGEELSHDGASAANDVITTSRVLINGEPTENKLAVGTKGAVRVIVRTAGRAAHSAYPELGHSATRELVKLLATLDELDLPSDPVLGATTVNIGSISGGVADNVIAPWAEARLMIRLVTPAEAVLDRLREFVGERAVLEVGPMVPPVHLGAIAGFPTCVAAYATDIPALTNWGTPYLYGPGSIHVAHTPDEYVEIADLDAAVHAYERLAIEALAIENSRGQSR